MKQNTQLLVIIIQFWGFFFFVYNFKIIKQTFCLQTWLSFSLQCQHQGPSPFEFLKKRDFLGQSNQISSWVFFLLFSAFLLFVTWCRCWRHDFTRNPGMNEKESDRSKERAKTTTHDRRKKHGEIFRLRGYEEMKKRHLNLKHTQRRMKD